MTSNESLKSLVASNRFEWRNYIEPPNGATAEECQSVDRYNKGVYESKNFHLPEINELLEKMHRQTEKVLPPPNYYQIYMKKYNETIREPDTKALLAIKFLADRGKYACKDYELKDAAALADTLAEAEYIAAQKVVDITAAVGYNHRQVCTCNNEWDGRSPTCKGMQAKVKWQRGPTHHFLQPSVDVILN
jgi:hypothetical protein